MAHLVRGNWVSYDLGFTRKDRRRACAYSAYMPDRLIGRSFTFSGECMADVAEAEAAIRSLNVTAATLASAEGLARLLLRAEAAASSRIEGMLIPAHRVLRAEAARELDSPGHPDVAAREVLGNVDAMVTALDAADAQPDVTLETILGIHKRLLKGTESESIAGKLRAGPGWIGGSPNDPCEAQYVPPPPAQILPLLVDLAAFCNDTSLPGVAHAAIVHAQFESIHPFADGNGRVGRALIHLILRRRGVAPSWCTPVSLVLATMHQDYIEGLRAYCYVGDLDSPEATAGLNRWVSLFAHACTRSVHDASVFEQRVKELQQEWRERVGPVRSDSSVELLIESLPANVIITVNEAVRLLGRSFTAANLAIEELVHANVLKQVNVGKRNRAFEATEVIDAFTQLERRLASPIGDTHAAPPVRPVPRRRVR